jgi:hypothetical protein
MLTESDKKWLGKREKRGAYFCFHCSGGDLEFPCLESWHSPNDCPVEDGQDYRDAAEFEARVAAKLATYEYTDPCLGKTICPYAGKGWTCSRCNLKHARLAVEEEMENGSAL